MRYVMTTKAESGIVVCLYNIKVYESSQVNNSQGLTITIKHVYF